MRVAARHPDARAGPQLIERRFDDCLPAGADAEGCGHRQLSGRRAGQLVARANAALGPRACVLDVLRWYERAIGVNLE
jgi:hypothetical protein